MEGNEHMSIEANLSLGKELNKLISVLRLSDEPKVEELIDQLMLLFSLNKINSDVEAQNFANKARQFLKSGGFYNASCFPALKESITKVLAEYKDENKFIYSNGVLIFIFTYTESEVKAEILNMSCVSTN